MRRVRNTVPARQQRCSPPRAQTACAHRPPPKHRREKLLKRKRKAKKQTLRKTNKKGEKIVTPREKKKHETPCANTCMQRKRARAYTHTCIFMYT